MKAVLICMALFAASPAFAQNAIVTGDGSVSVEGGQAATQGDVAAGSNAPSVVTGGSSNVFIGGKPAVTAGDETGCGGVVTGGSSSVFINGKPMVTAGSAVSGCAQ